MVFLEDKYRKPRSLEERARIEGREMTEERLQQELYRVMTPVLEDEQVSLFSRALDYIQSTRAYKQAKEIGGKVLVPDSRIARSLMLASGLAIAGAAVPKPGLAEIGGFIEENLTTQMADAGEDVKTEADIKKEIQNIMDAAAETAARSGVSKEQERQRVAEHVREAPDIAIGQLHESKDSEYIGTMVETAVETNPSFAFRYYSMEEGRFGYDDAQVLQEHVKRSADADVELFRSIADSDLDRNVKKNLFDIMGAIEHNGWSVEEAAQVEADPHAYRDALMDSIAHGNEGQRQNAERTMRMAAENAATEMNAKKGQPDRFASLSGASSKEIYGMVVFGGEKARPSTDQGMFYLLFDAMQKEGTSPEELLADMNGAHVETFAATASFAHRLDDFARLSENPEAQKQIISEVVKSVESGDTKEKLSEVSKVVFSAKEASVQRDLKEAIETNYLQAKEEGNQEAMVAYGLLSGLYGEEATWLGEEAKDFTIETRAVMENETFFNEDGENIQAYYFYNDADGEYSFNNFKAQHGSDWELVDHGTFIELTKTVEGRTVKKIANKPETSSIGEHDYLAEKDPGVNGQEDMEQHLAQKEESPQILVHRGHSYWRHGTVGAIQEDLKLFFDGSCGGTTAVEDALSRAPDAEAIYNSEEGKAVINDTILREITDRLLAGEDLDMQDLREDIAKELAEFDGEAGSTHHDYTYPDQDEGKAAKISKAYSDLQAQYGGAS